MVYDPIASGVGNILATGFCTVLSRDNGAFKDTRSGTTWDQFLHGLGVGTGDVIHGAAASLPMQALDAVTWPGRAISRSLGYPATAPSDMIGNATDSVLPTPQTDAERRNSLFTRGGAAALTSGLPGAVAGGAIDALPSIVRPLLSTPLPGSFRSAATQAVGGGTGAVVGDKLAGSDLVPPWLKPTVNLVGNMAGNVGVNTISGALTTLKNAMTGNLSDLAQAYARLGIKPGTVGAVSQNPAVLSTEALLAGSPFAKGTIRQGWQNTINGFGNAVENTARTAETDSGANPGVPRVGSPQTLGGIAQDGTRDWLKNTWPTIEGNAWQPVNDAMRPAGDVVNLSGYRSALQRAASDARLSGMPATDQAFATSKIQNWLDALDADAPPGTNVSWDAAHAIKQRIGNAMGKSNLVGDIGSDTLDSLYGGLAGDMQRAAVLNGAGQHFDVANAVSTAGRTIMKGTLSKIVTGQNPNQEAITQEGAGNAVLNGNSDDLGRIRALMPGTADAAAALKLRQAAQATPGQQEAGQTTSTSSFLTGLRRQQMDHPEGTEALFSNPDVSSNVADLATVAAHLRALQSNLNTSGSGGAIQLLSLIPQMGAAYEAGGLPAMGATAVGNVGGPFLTAKALTNPIAIGLAKAQRAAPPAVPGLLGGITSSQAASSLPSDAFVVRRGGRTALPP